MPTCTSLEKSRAGLEYFGICTSNGIAKSYKTVDSGYQLLYDPPKTNQEMMTRMQFGDMREHSSSDECLALMTADNLCRWQKKPFAIYSDLSVKPFLGDREGVLEVCWPEGHIERHMFK